MRFCLIIIACFATDKYLSKIVQHPCSVWGWGPWRESLTLGEINIEILSECRCEHLQEARKIRESHNILWEIEGMVRRVRSSGNKSFVRGYQKF